jgi:hypothetical protein
VAAVLRACVGALACAGVLALAASPALADGTDPDYPGSVLHVTTTGSDVAGKVLTIVATGTNDPSAVVPIDYGLRLFAINHKLLPGPCSQTLSPKLHGRTVLCAVTAKSPAGSATATSRPFKIS